jgi:hypothetical protein
MVNPKANPMIFPSRRAVINVKPGDVAWWVVRWMNWCRPYLGALLYGGSS